MAEKVNNKPIEKHNGSAEHLVQIADKQNEVIRSKLDEAEALHRDRQSEQEMLAAATELAKDRDNSAEKHLEDSHKRQRGAPSKKQLNGSFKSQMQQVQEELGPSSRLLSRLLHLQPVEKVSDAVSSTIGRPRPMLYGSIAAFIAVTLLYFVARYYGYRLSGFETIAAFCIGWSIGIGYDYASTFLRRRKP